MIELFFTGIIIGVIVSCPIGPSGMLCIQRTLSKGQLSGFFSGLGVAFSDLFYATGTSLFMGLLVNFIQANERPLQIIGSILMVLIGYYIYQKNPGKNMQGDQEKKQTLVQDFVTTFLLTFSNMLIVILFIGLFAQYGFVLPEHSFRMTIAGLLGIFAGAVFWWIFITFIVSLMRNWFNDRGLKILNRVMGGIIMALATAGFLTAITGCMAKEKKTIEHNMATSTEALKDFKRPELPLMIIDPKEKAGYIITHYWDKFNFADTMYCHAPEITDQAFVGFIITFPYASYDKVCEGVKKLLTMAEVDAVMYNYFFKLAENYLYDPNSLYCNDEYFIPFLEQLVASEKVMDEYKIRARYQLQLVKRNRPGAKAEDIVYTTANGSTGRLYSISALYVLLMFFNPDCQECKQTIAQIKGSPVFSSAISTGKLKVLAVYPDENLEIWRNNLSDIPASWINGYNIGLSIKNNQIYDLKAIPTLYLLDANKLVILKDAPIQVIQDYLQNLSR